MSTEKSLKTLPVWYEKGVKFKCTECGKCCTGPSGYVWITEKDIDKLAKHLHLSKEEFKKKYTRIAYERIALKDKNSKGDCIFLNQKKCEVYTSRPIQCQAFPWWSGILDSKQSWDTEAKDCEGINHPEGKLFSKEEIQEKLEEYENAKKIDD